MRALTSNVCFRLLAQMRSMSVSTARKTITALRAQYVAGTPITMLTAYDYPSALHAERADVDIVLVGDSLGMVVLGHSTTQMVTLENMIHHSAAARKAVNKSLLVADLPFGSYEKSPETGMESAVRLIKEASVDAVKLEGGVSRANIISRIVDGGIAVMGHVGLQPQSVSLEGSFRSTGRTAEAAMKVIEDAQAVQDAGAFAIVLECVPQKVAALVTDALDIPVIGIGSGVSCDGQVLVYHDMLGIMSHPEQSRLPPRFSKSYADLGPTIDLAISSYRQEVQAKVFPSESHSPYAISDEEHKKLQVLLAAKRKAETQSTERS